MPESEPSNEGSQSQRQKSRVSGWLCQRPQGSCRGPLGKVLMVQVGKERTLVLNILCFCLWAPEEEQQGWLEAPGARELENTQESVST